MTYHDNERTENGCGIRPFAHKGRYSRSTMMKWSKRELINYIECCEHNEKNAYETLEQQARNFELMLNNIKNYKEPIQFGENEERFAEMQFDEMNDNILKFRKEERFILDRAKQWIYIPFMAMDGFIKFYGKLKEVEESEEK